MLAQSHSSSLNKLVPSNLSVCRHLVDCYRNILVRLDQDIPEMSRNQNVTNIKVSILVYQREDKNRVIQTDVMKDKLNAFISIFVQAPAVFCSASVFWLQTL